MAPANDVPQQYQHYNVNPLVLNQNETPEVCASVRGTGISIDWQNGPRLQADGTLAEPNGAFVEDAIYAALARLQHFNESEFRCRENSVAITHLEEALMWLKHRQVERSARNVEGSGTV